MNPDEITDVFAECALYDYRFAKADLMVAGAWYRVLHDLDLVDALHAVRVYYADNTNRIMPADIRRGVKAIREERRRSQPAAPRELPSRFEDDMGRRVRIEAGVSTIRGVLGPLLEHIAAQRPELPSAFDELRALTSEPTVIDLDDDAVDGESL